MTANSSTKPAKKPVPEKSKIRGLPPEADLQWVGERLAVFYRYRSKNKEVRKYLGSVTDMTFRPNVKFQTNPSDFPVPQKKAVGRRVHILRERKPVVQNRHQERLAGAAADYNVALGSNLLLLQAWQEKKADADLMASLVDVFGESRAKILYPQILTAALFMAHSGMSGKWQIDSWCQTHAVPAALTDQATSDLFRELGLKGDALKAAFIQRRLSRLEGNELLALDGTNVGCDAKGIELVKAGKGKTGLIRDQIAISYLFSCTSGQPVAYDLLPGNMADISSMEVFLDRWDSLNLKDKVVRVAFDRGYYKHAMLVAFCKRKVQFVVAAKTELSIVAAIINECCRTIEDYDNWNHAKKCFGITREILLDPKDPETKVWVHVYMNPKTRAKEMAKFSTALEKTEIDWKCGAGEFNEEMAPYFETPVKGLPLKRKKAPIQHKFATSGFFAIVSNAYSNCHGALAKYGLRNAIEVCFKTAKSETGLSKVRVHSTPNFKGKAFINFFAVIGASVVMSKMANWKSFDDPKKPSLQPLNRNMGYHKLLSTLEGVRLQKTAGCSAYVTNATQRVRDYMDRLRVPELYDEPAKVMDLLLNPPNLKLSKSSSTRRS